MCLQDAASMPFGISRRLCDQRDGVPVDWRCPAARATVTDLGSWR